MQRFWPVVLLCAVACGDVTGPSTVVIEPAYRLTPPAIYADWWMETAVCAGAEPSLWGFRAVDWFVVHAERFTVTLPALAHRQLAGLWRDGTITIAEPFVYEPRLVRHEMMHAILGTERHTQTFVDCDLMWWVGEPATY